MNKAKSQEKCTNSEHRGAISDIVARLPRRAIEGHILEEAAIATVVHEDMRLVVVVACLSIRPDQCQFSIEAVIGNICGEHFITRRV